MANGMGRLPLDLCTRIFSFLDHPSLAASLQVCRKWKELCGEDELWRKLFKERWGEDAAEFFAPADPSTRSWKDVYQVQDRCDRVGVGLKIVREGSNYYLVYQGEIQRFLGSCENETTQGEVHQRQQQEQDHSTGISERILFFIGDLETACLEAKRVRA